MTSKPDRKVRGLSPSNRVPTDVLCHSRRITLDSPRDRSSFIALFLNAVRRAGSRPETPVEPRYMPDTDTTDTRPEVKAVRESRDALETLANSYLPCEWAAETLLAAADSGGNLIFRSTGAGRGGRHA